MKKKIYTTPSLSIVAFSYHGSLLNALSGVRSEEKDIPYGGVDEEGSITPGARRQNNVWDEEEEE